MIESAFNKFYWGFFFIMIDFRLQGIDILPDIIGYLLFAAGFSLLASRNASFVKGKNLNTVMIILSIFQLYERPAQQSGINFGFLGGAGVLIGIASTIIGLFVVYNLFMGIQGMADSRGLTSIGQEAQKRWNQYLILQLAGLFSIITIIVPPIALIFIIVLLIFGIILTIVIMGFMKKCAAGFM